MERIGEYLVRRLLGEGGMGKVFEAEERLSKRRVALKLLKPELARSEEGRRLFLNEMAILSKLDHPNVVRCLACSEADGQLVMTLEYLEGKTLREHLSEQAPLSWSRAVAITVQVAFALDAAHRQEPAIVHRDLKPENIMVLPGGAVKVMDFGIAKVLEAMHKTTTQSVGTLQYMSPEQIDAAGVDARSDLYCLGLVLYEMLSGHPPFDAASPRQLLNQQCTEPPPPLDAGLREVLPRGVERLLMALLEKAPDDRPQTAREVLEQLEPFAPAQAMLGTSARDEAAAEVRPDLAEQSERAPRHATSRVAQRSTSGHGSVHGHTPAPHKDTVALLDGPAPRRQVPERLAWATIIGLSLVAGLVTYLFRAEQAQPAAAPTTASAQQGLIGD